MGRWPWVLGVAGCAARTVPLADPAPSGREVVVLGDAPPEVEAEVRAYATRALEGLASVLGSERVPSRVTVRLEGPAAEGQVPTVDPQTGDVLLYEFPGPGGGYTASLAHELVHAARRSLWTDETRQTDPFLFLEEGTAELFAVEAGFPSGGFPLFGTPLAVAAGQWIASGEDVPIEALVTDHRSLNYRCLAQSYTLRLSFVTWLRQTRGLDPLMALVWQAEPITVAHLEQAMGTPLSALARDWRAWALAAYEALPDPAAEAERYRTDSPIRWLPVCDSAGVRAEMARPTPEHEE